MTSQSEMDIHGWLGKHYFVKCCLASTERISGKGVVRCLVEKILKRSLKDGLNYLISEVIADRWA